MDERQAGFNKLWEELEDLKARVRDKGIKNELQVSIDALSIMILRLDI